MKQLNRLSTKYINRLLENNLLSDCGKEFQNDREELSSILWSRQLAQDESKTNNRLNDIEKEHNRFKRNLKAYKHLFKLNGDTQELRDLITHDINDYNNFCNAI